MKVRLTIREGDRMVEVVVNNVCEDIVETGFYYYVYDDVDDSDYVHNLLPDWAAAKIRDMHLGAVDGDTWLCSVGFKRGDGVSFAPIPDNGGAE